MSAHMKKHRIEKDDQLICMRHKGEVYQFPKKIADQYKVTDDAIHPDEVFKDLNQKYTKPGALLLGIRLREGLTQTEMAEKIQVTQSDISQMESGTRKIGRKVAQRIAALFDVDYRLFLD